MILVYCKNLTTRHRYIFDFVFRDMSGIDYRLTDDSREFQAFNGAKLNYSRAELAGSVQIQPHPILGESGIRPQETGMGIWRGFPVFFLTNGPSLLPFDPFAMAFFLITRYEEYLPFEADEHGRFCPGSSLAFKEKFLDIPLADAIFHEIKGIFRDLFPGLEIKGHTFRFVPTVDIDIAFAHSGKGWGRAAAAWLKLLAKADFNQIRERIAVLTDHAQDPYNNFRMHRELANEFGHRLCYFVLAGDFSRYDRNTSFRNKAFRELILALSKDGKVGLHPSYRSHLQPDTLRKEKKRVEGIIQRQITNTRFHFLRLRFPESFRILIEEGITDDYSLGYSTLNGFRAGTCTPFLFYDLSREEITGLRMHPFIFMDSAMTDHMKVTPDEAVNRITELVEKVKRYGGEAVGIWHNYSLSEQGQYRGWQFVFREIFKQYGNRNL